MTKFFICPHCGNIIGMIHESGVPVVCCGEKMKRLEPGTVEASVEKHLPVVKVDGGLVSIEVGSVTHPMSEEHHIAWVYLQTNCGGQRKSLPHDGAPSVSFALAEGEEPIAVFAYCNLHGLWMTEIA